MRIKILYVFITFFSFMIAPHLVFPAEKPENRMDRAQLLSVFKKGAWAEGVILDGRDLVEIIKTTDYPIKIRNAVIEHGLDFSELDLEVLDRIQFPESWSTSEKEALHTPKPSRKFYVVNNGIEISHTRIARIKMPVSASVIFLKSVVFSASTFEGTADFGGAIFDRSVHFDRVGFRKNVAFKAATFRGDAHFSRSRFTGESYFNTSTFRQNADFSFSAFTRLADFKAADFQRRLSLASARFAAYTDFRDTVIGQLDFDSARRPAVIVGRFDFRRAIISDAHFQDVFFEKDIDFSDAIFIRVLFRDVSFEEDVYFLRTKFRLQTALYDTRFKGVVDFTDADLRSNQHFLMSYVSFNALKISWPQFPPLRVWRNNADKKIESFLDIERTRENPRESKETRMKIGGVEKLSEVVSGLEAALRIHRRLNDANRAYYEIKTFELNEARQGKTLWQWFWSQPTWIIWWATTGFGMQLMWILLWCFGINLFFTGLYFFGGHLSASPEPDDAFRLRILDFPKRYYTKIAPDAAQRDDPISRFFNLFGFSAVILMKIGYRSRVINGRIGRLHYKWIVRLQWLLGLYLLAALSYTLQNVVPVVNKLVTGVF